VNAREIRGGDRSPSPLSIRPLATPQEAEACARIMAASEPWLTLRRSYETSLAILTEPGREVHVAVDDRGLAGFLILDLRGPFTGYIQTVCVEPARRGCGVGTRLVQWAEERIGKESPNVFLCVSSFNREARRLYERLGYQLVGTLTDYLVPGHDEHLFRKTNGSWEAFRAGRTPASNW
jgi:ribosomal-protein-alanine N-acetyltransferase